MRNTCEIHAFVGPAADKTEWVETREPGFFQVVFFVLDLSPGLRARRAVADPGLAIPRARWPIRGCFARFADGRRPEPGPRSKRALRDAGSVFQGFVREGSDTCASAAMSRFTSGLALGILDKLLLKIIGGLMLISFAPGW